MQHELTNFNQLKLKAANKAVIIHEPKESNNSPAITVEGISTAAEEIVKDLNDVIDAIFTNDHPLIIRRPGTIRYLLSKDGQSIMSGIERQQKSCLQLKLSTNRFVESPMSTAVVSKKCIAYTKEAKMITLVMGDITEYPVDVIVNASNATLDHADGVTADIVRKGGQIIEEESKSYIHNKGSLCDGDAIIVKEVGNLPCQRLVHAVFPKWNGGGSSKESELINACIKSLNLANQYCTIAFPGNVYGFPLRVYARSMIKAFISWSQSNDVSTLYDIRIMVSNATFANAFSEEIRKNVYLPLNVDDAAAADDASCIQNRVDKEQSYSVLDKHTDLPSADIHFAKQHIELHYGNILDYQVVI